MAVELVVPHGAVPGRKTRIGPVGAGALAGRTDAPTGRVGTSAAPARRQPGAIPVVGGAVVRAFVALLAGGAAPAVARAGDAGGARTRGVVAAEAVARPLLALTPRRMTVPLPVALAADVQRARPVLVLPSLAQAADERPDAAYERQDARGRKGTAKKPPTPRACPNAAWRRRVARSGAAGRTRAAKLRVLRSIRTARRRQPTTPEASLRGVAPSRLATWADVRVRLLRASRQL